MLREVAIGRVHPDLLLGEWQRPLSPSSGRRLTFKDCAILAALALGDQTVAALESGRIGSVVIEGVEPCLLRLATRGLVMRRGRNRWTIATHLPVWSCRVTAIEAKLQRWQDALAQALTYRFFAHRSYVLLDGSQVSLNRPLTLAFKSSGVGLLVRYPRGLALAVDAVDIAPDSSHLIFAIDKLRHSGTAYISRSVHL